MTGAGAFPWPDGRAPAAPAAAQPARTGLKLPSLDFLVAVAVVVMFSGCWIVFVIGPQGDASAGVIVMALHAPAYLAALFLLSRRPGRAVRAALGTPLLWLLILLVGASTLWSVNPGVTERRFLALVFTTLAGAALAARFDWAELSEVLGASFAFLILLSIAMAVALPTWGRMTTEFPGAWRGPWPDKNALGGHMAKGFVLLIAAAVLNPTRRPLWALASLGALFLMLASGSKTALVTAFMGAGALGFVFLVRRGGPPAVLAVFGGVTGLAALAFVGVFAREQAFGVLGKDATLTGRTAIWGAAELEIAKQPWLGYGYQSVWATDDRWTPLGWIVKHAKFRAYHAHNSWIDTALGLGRVGLAAWGAVFVEFWLRSLWAVGTSRGAWLALPFLVIYSVQSLTESIAYIYNDFTWVIFVALLTRLALPRAAGDGGRDGRAAAAPAP